MTTARGGWWIGMLAATLVLSGACGTEKQTATQPDGERPVHFGAENLHGLDQPKGGIYEALDPAEREALDKSGMTGADAPRDAADEAEPVAEQSKSDKAGKMVMSALVVAVTAAAAAAPYLLF